MLSVTLDATQVLFIAGGLVGAALIVQLALALLLVGSLRRSSREQQQLSRELFGVMRKIEGLTAQRREQIVKHYDSMLETLSTRLPPAVAAQTSELVIELEKKILTRLAELEPHFENDEASQRKMDALIQSMESLERSVVALASDTVRRVMAEGRRSLMDDPIYLDMNMAA